MEQKDREIQHNETGTCPFCNSTNYSRGSLEPTDDNIFTDCECLCGKTFKETFILKYQDWEE